MRTATTVFTMLLTAASITPGASAQDPGTPVSVLVPHPIEGWVRQPAILDRVEGDSIWVQVANATTALPIDRVRPQVASGSYAKHGLIAGALLGAVAGGIVGYRGYTQAPRHCSPGGTSMLFGDYGPSCSGGYDSWARAEEAINGAGPGLVGGLLLGWIVGSQIERWTPLQVGTHVTPGGDVVLSLSR